MDNRLYLITGAAGFLGNTIVRKLLAQNCAVRGLILNPRDREIFGGAALEFVCGDMRDVQSLEPLFANPAHRELIVIHTASMVSIAEKFDQTVYDINVTGVANLLALCEKHSVKRLIHVSSVHAIPELPMGELIREVVEFSPDTVHGTYAKTKAQASRLVLESARAGLDCCIIHPTGIIGRGDYGRTHLNQMVVDYLAGRLTACVKGGYDFVDVGDVADGVIACVERGVSGECYILSNRYCTVREVLDLLHKISGKPRVKVVLPLWFAKLTAPLAEQYYRILHQPPLYTPYSLYTLESNANFSHEKATARLGYHPHELETTLREMVAWLVEREKREGRVEK